jgi:hypothetical protein
VEVRLPPGDVAAALEAMQTTLQDADAELVTVLGGHREVTSARVWQGRVLVDWEPDEQAGDCLLRSALIRRLIALHAEAALHAHGSELRLHAKGRIVVSLSESHRELVGQLGGEARVELHARLRFDAAGYAGGEESYAVVDAGRRLEVLKLSARVTRRMAQGASPRTLPGRT